MPDVTNTEIAAALDDDLEPVTIDGLELWIAVALA